MTPHRPDKLKPLAINTALVVTLIGSLAIVVWARVIAARIDYLIGQAIEARGAGDTSAFEGYRESAHLLLQVTQDQQTWLYAGYFGVGLVLVAAVSRRMAKARTLNR